ncbi:phosphoglycerate mutase family protein [Ancylostoma caninum]|uniref:Phosphoglycerate mutase family protein n=1 Tax=Ancylostoma caninum TaxID=29170 RepID=A0A368GKS0_ANCCA|nr:phosphoglycerate mutase family protein [Ancylostoma caninum]
MTFREDNINVSWRKLPLARDLAIDNSMLSERGRGQAKECAARFRNINITNVFASPYDRTIQTASIIAAEKNLLVKLDSLPQPEPGLCEALHHCCDPPGFWIPEKLKEKYPLVDTKYIPAFPRVRQQVK